MTPAALDLLANLADLSVHALGLCEVGRDYSLRCDPRGLVVAHFVLEGKGCFLSELGRFPLAAGSLMVVPAGLRHSLRGTGPIMHFRDTDEAVSLAGGLLSYRAFEGAADLVVGSAVLSATLGGKLPLFKHLNQPTLEHCEDKELLARLPRMLKELRSAVDGTRTSVSAEMKQIIMALLKSPVSSSISLLSPTMHPGLAEALEAVLSSPHEDHSLDRLAAIASMSRVRFRYHFSKACSCRPQEFVLAVRLAQAARLLQDSNLEIKQIAASVGVQRGHFARAFRAHFGLSASQFRQGSAAR